MTEKTCQCTAPTRPRDVQAPAACGCAPCTCGPREAAEATTCGCAPCECADCAC